MPYNSIISLIYISTARAGLTDDDFQAIAETSRRNNEGRSITGLLVYNGTNFMQVLEGSVDDVNNCAAAIANDPRHHGMVVINREEREQREFPKWSMASYITVNGVTDCSKKWPALLDHDLVAETTRGLFNSFRSLGIPVSKE